jgi:hypothetical protein
MMSRRRLRKRTSKGILANRRWKREENILRNNMYQVKENAVPKIGVREGRELESE